MTGAGAEAIGGVTRHQQCSGCMWAATYLHGALEAVHGRPPLPAVVALRAPGASGAARARARARACAWPAICSDISSASRFSNCSRSSRAASSAGVSRPRARSATGAPAGSAPPSPPRAAARAAAAGVRAAAAPLCAPRHPGRPPVGVPTGDSVPEPAAASPARSARPSRLAGRQGGRAVPAPGLNRGLVMGYSAAGARSPPRPPAPASARRPSGERVSDPDPDPDPEHAAGRRAPCRPRAGGALPSSLCGGRAAACGALRAGALAFGADALMQGSRPGQRCQTPPLLGLPCASRQRQPCCATSAQPVATFWRDRGQQAPAPSPV